MRTHIASPMLAALSGLVVSAAAGQGVDLAVIRMPEAPSPRILRIVSWDDLEDAGLDFLDEARWPAEVRALDGASVRLCGYASLRPGAQDSIDLMLTPGFPTPLECGVSDPTRRVDLYLVNGGEGIATGRTVTVWGRFELSRTPGDPPYRIVAVGWRPASDGDLESASVAPVEVDDGRREDVLPDDWDRERDVEGAEGREP